MGEGQQQSADPARTYASLVGGGLILFGLAGFFYSSSFATGDDLVAEKAFGLFYVNGWQNVLHLAAGAAGLALAARAGRLYCLGSGIVWTILAVGGFFGSHGGEEVPSMGGFLPAGTATDVLNLALGCLAFATLAATAPAREHSASKQTSPKNVPKKPRREAKRSGKAQPIPKPHSRVDTGTSIGKPRSASQGNRPQRGPIN